MRILTVIGTLFCCSKRQHCKRFMSFFMSAVLFLICFSGCSSKIGSGEATLHLHTATSDPTCTAAAYCSCGYMVAPALEHNYQNGFCTYCGIRDSSYFNPDNYGFSNFYGMKKWIYIDGYSIGGSDPYAYTKSSSHPMMFEFKNSVYYLYQYDKHTEEYDLSNKDVYEYESNDVIGLYGFSEYLFIMDRVSDSSGHLILKTELDDFEMWFILADQVDWERSPEISESGGATFYFK